jgi:hypothetical protein
MVALDILLNHVNFGVEGLDDKQLKVKLLKQIQQEFRELVVGLAKHFIHGNESEGFGSTSTHVDAILVSYGCRKDGGSEAILLPSRLPRSSRVTLSQVPFLIEFISSEAKPITNVDDSGGPRFVIL